MEQDGQQQMPRPTNRNHRVTPAVTRSQSRSSPMGVSGAFALLAAEADIAAAVAQGEAGYHEAELPLDSDMPETPTTYAQAHSGPHDAIWREAERKEFVGLAAVGTFEPVGGT